MNTTPIQPDSYEREELARLLPEPVERDLPSGRRLQLQEFVMSEIHQDLSGAGPAPRRAPKRRLVSLASALTAVAAATAAAVVIGIGGFGGSEGTGSTPPAGSALSGQQILLAAAATAEQAPEGSGNYWYVKVVSKIGDRKSNEWENWTQRDGQTWFRGDKTQGNVVKMVESTPFRLAGSEISLDQLNKLPTEPDPLKAWIADSVRNGDVRTSAGRLTADQQQQLAFEGLISLVSQLPAPPQVRGAAFEAIASYPEVKSLGAVEGGQGLEISLPHGTPAKLVIDPATSQIRETNWFVTTDGSNAGFAGRDADLGAYALVAEWTDKLPT